MGSILVKNGKIWDGEKFFFADILTRDNIIECISENIKEHADYVYDAKGKIVSPGLVDAHVHIKNISSDEFGINAEMSSFPFGVTCVADAGGGKGNKALLDNLGVKNLVFVYAEIVNNKACFENTEKLLEAYGEKAIGIKVYYDTTISDIRDLTPLREIVAFAQKKNLKVMVHSSNPPVSMSELLSVLRKGDILTHAYHGGVNNISDDCFRCIIEAKNRGIIIDTGFAGHVHTDFKILKNAIEYGAKPDTISTDITKWSAYKRGGRYGMTMCMSIAKHLGMKEEDIFKSVTSTPAKALGKEKEWGYLLSGRKADIAVFDYCDKGFDMTDKSGNRIKSKKSYRCILTISDGEIVYLV